MIALLHCPRARLDRGQYRRLDRIELGLECCEAVRVATPERNAIQFCTLKPQQSRVTALGCKTNRLGNGPVRRQGRYDFADAYAVDRPN